MANEKQKSVFETLSAINVNDKVEKKNGLTYLSWAWAWGEVKKNYPDATYSIVRCPVTQQLYFFDSDLGYMVMTSVTIQDQTLEMWLPVMDGANKAMTNHAYTYSTRYGDKTVEAATMFDINKTLMRCLTKNLAMFGLGHYIFAGEDLPESESDTPVKSTSKASSTPAVAKPPVKAAAKAPAKPAEQQAEKSSLPELTEASEHWAKVTTWLKENQRQEFDNLTKIISQRFLVGAEALKSLKAIHSTNE